MPRLFHPSTERAVTLGARTLVGRAPTCSVQLSHRRVSGEHAVIAFARDAWQLRDLGSRNGTTVDGQPVKVGTPVALRAGARIDFAGDPWVFAGEGPPVARAHDGARTEAAFEAQLALPDARNPIAVIFPIRAGRWLAEVDGLPQYVTDGAVLEVAGTAWTLELPPIEQNAVIDPTAASAIEQARSVGSLIRLTLRPSLDEESVQTTLSFADGDLVVPPRAAHLLLLHLARERLSDLANGLADAEQGWVYAEVLADALGMDPQRINVEVYRARRQLTRLGIGGAAELFERRPQTRQIRLGIPRVVVLDSQ